MTKTILKRVLACVLSIAMIFSFGTFSNVAKAKEITLKKGTYTPGDAVVLIDSKNIEKSSTKSLATAKADEQIGDDYGEYMKVIGEGKDAAREANFLADIISDSLGDDFTIEENTDFGDMNAVLVHSDSMTTEDMISALQSNEKVKAVDANYKVKFNAYDDYSLNDPLNPTAVHANSSQSNNTSGKNVLNRGVDAANEYSVNASSAWSQLSGDEDVPVVAIVDSGVLSSHEDLKDIMWTNPGNIGLKGTHGYCFGLNEDNPDFDQVGHGTHCAGLVAAQANNGKGTAGVASKANCQIMGLSIDGGDGTAALYPAMGSFSYIIKAKKKGVNVVSVNCSWASGGENSSVYGELLDEMGENGILTCLAAGNEAHYLDNMTNTPTSSNSEYTVVVNCARNDGKPAGFTNWGYSTTDLFAPGFNQISTLAYPCFFPMVYDEAKVNEKVDYLAEFSNDTVVENNEVIPDTRAGTSAKTFGKSQFFQGTVNDAVVDEATNKLRIDNKTYISNQDNAASLHWTIEDAQLGGVYTLFFPFETNPECEGAQNTHFQCLYNMISQNNTANTIALGEAVKNADGTVTMVGGGATSAMRDQNHLQARNLFSNYKEDMPNQMLSYEEAQGKDTGFAIQLTPRDDYWKAGEKKNIDFCIDSFSISKPNIELSRQDAYDCFSGTSMASPVTAGSIALLASLNPKDASQSGADYAREIKSKLFTCVDETEVFKDLCSTGGQLDLNNITKAKPAISNYKVDSDKKTITLEGANLNGGVSLKYKRLAVDGSEPTTIPVTKSDKDMYVDFAADGKTATIYNATPIINTYTRFTVENATGDIGNGSFYLVRGEKKLSKVNSLRMASKQGDQSVSYENQDLFTDKSGDNLFAFGRSSGALLKLVDNELVQAAEGVTDAMKDAGLIDNYDIYDQGNNVSLNFAPMCSLIGDEGIVYGSCYVSEDEQQTHYFATIDLNSSKPKWTFKKYSDQTSINKIIESCDATAFMDGKIWYLTNRVNAQDVMIGKALYSYDVANDKFTKHCDWDYTYNGARLVPSNGKLYAFYGSRYVGKDQPGVVSKKIFCYENGQFKEIKSGIPFVGKVDASMGDADFNLPWAKTKTGPIFIGPSLDGIGNVYTFSTSSNNFTPTYYTIEDSFADNAYRTACATKKGIYVFSSYTGEDQTGYDLYLLPVSSGVFESIFPEDKPQPTPTPTPTPKVTKPGKTKVVKAKKKSAKKISVKLKKVKGAKGYQVAVYKSKKTKKALVKKYYKKVKFTIKSKKFKKKKKLYVSARAYKLNGKKKVYGKWCKRKKVKK